MHCQTPSPYLKPISDFPQPVHYTTNLSNELLKGFNHCSAIFCVLNCQWIHRFWMGGSPRGAGGTAVCTHPGSAMFPAYHTAQLCALPGRKTGQGSHVLLTPFSYFLPHLWLFDKGSKEQECPQQQHSWVQCGKTHLHVFFDLLLLVS